MVKFIVVFDEIPKLHHFYFEDSITMQEFRKYLRKSFSLPIDLYRIFMKQQNGDDIEIFNLNFSHFQKAEDTVFLHLKKMEPKASRFFKVEEESIPLLSPKTPGMDQQKRHFEHPGTILQGRTDKSIKIYFRAHTKQSQPSEEEEIRKINKLAEYKELVAYINEHKGFDGRFTLHYSFEGQLLEIHNKNDLDDCYKRFQREKTIRMIVYPKVVKYQEETVKYESWRRYLIQSRGKFLGEGSSGRVFLGVDRLTGKLIANKNQLTRDAHERKRVEDELTILQSLRHKNIIEYLDSYTGDQGKEVNIYMEYAPGGNILKFLRGNFQFDEFIFRKYARDMLEGLEFLHSNKVVHGDLKGTNVLIGADGNAKLADFGLSHKMFKFGQKQKYVKGTVNFIAPETVVKGIQDYPSDVWSFGCLLCELAGKTPWVDLEKSDVDAGNRKYYARSTHDDLFAKIRRQFILGNIPQIPTNITLEAQIFIKKCLTINHKLRPTVKELLKDPFVYDYDLNSFPIQQMSGPTNAESSESEYESMERTFSDVSDVTPSQSFLTDLEDGDSSSENEEEGEEERAKLEKPKKRMNRVRNSYRMVMKKKREIGEKEFRKSIYQHLHRQKKGKKKRDRRRTPSSPAIFKNRHRYTNSTFPGKYQKNFGKLFGYKNFHSGQRKPKKKRHSKSDLKRKNSKSSMSKSKKRSSGKGMSRKNSKTGLSNMGKK